MTCRGCGRPWCRCRVDSTDTVARRGSGNPGDPYEFEVVLDDATTNAVTQTDEGLLMVHPVTVTQPIAFSVRQGGAPDSGLIFGQLDAIVPTNAQECRVVSFDQVIHDTGGLFDTSANAFVVPRAGLWELGGSSDTFDAPDDFGVFIVIDGTFAIVANGPFLVDAFSGTEPVITHIDLEASQRVQLCVSSDYDDITLSTSTFFGAFLGD